MTSAVEIASLRVVVGDAAEGLFRLTVDLLDLPPGACLAITGPSGCGKSTLLEVLAGLRRPTEAARLVVFAGGAAIDLASVRDPAVLRQGVIGYVPQSGGVLPFLTAREQVLAPVRLAGRAHSAEAAARLDRYAIRFDLSDHMTKRRSLLSGGQRKRVALIAGLAVPRVLLLADEPTSGLDGQNAQLVMEALAEVARTEGSVVIIATHDTDLARAAGFDLVEINDGALRVVDKRPPVCADV